MARRGKPAERIELPAKLVPLFLPPHLRVRASYGGRGSAKTRSFATMSAVRALNLSAQGKRGVIICAREFQNSLRDSSFAEVERAIEATPWLAPHFSITRQQIETKDGRIRFVFSGLRHSLGSIKSIADIHLVWVDEAEPVTETAWQTLFPTVRAPGSEVWVTWNPQDPDSATNKRFRDIDPARGMSVEMNHTDNPWFTGTLEDDRLADQANLDPGTYAHVWEGAYLVKSDAQVLADKLTLQEFEPTRFWGGPYYGLDFGYAQSPTAAVECWIHDDCLWIRREAYRHRLELDDTSEYLRTELPGIERHEIQADSARPESIGFLARHGLTRVRGVAKWPGSVADGIAHLRSFRRIVVHPACRETAREMRLYSYALDRYTGKPTDTLVDAYNHLIDAARYAMVPVLRARQIAPSDQWRTTTK